LCVQPPGPPPAAHISVCPFSLPVHFCPCRSHLSQYLVQLRRLRRRLPPPARVITTLRVGACLPVPIHDLAGYATSYVISISFRFISLGLMPHARMHASPVSVSLPVVLPGLPLVLFSFSFGLLCRCWTRTRILSSALGPGTQPLDWKRLLEPATAVQQPAGAPLLVCLPTHSTGRAVWGEERPFDAGMSHSQFEFSIFWPFFFALSSFRFIFDSGRSPRWVCD
jgi:hypothetical protein